MPTVTPKILFKFMQGRVEAVAQTLVGSIRVAMPEPKSPPKPSKKKLFGETAPEVPAALATNVVISIRPSAGSGAPTFLQELPIQVGEGTWSLQLPDLHPGSRHWILFEIGFDQPTGSALSRRRVAEIELAWSPTLPGKGNRRTRLNADVELVNRVLVEPPDPEIQRRHALLISGRSDG